SRPHGLSGGGSAPSRVHPVAAAAADIGRDAGRFARGRGPAGVHVRQLRAVSHDWRHARARHGGTGADASGEPPGAGGGHRAEHTRLSRRVDPESSVHAAQDPDAPESVAATAIASIARVPGDAQVSAEHSGEHDALIPAPQPPLPARATLPDDLLASEHEHLDALWSDGRGFWAWVTTVNHKSIAKRYIVTAFLM